MPNKRAQTLTEILITAVITVIFFTSAIGVFAVSKAFYSSSMAGQELQRSANWIMTKIVKGQEEGGTRYGLRSAQSFTTPITPVTEIDFKDTDGNTRKYYLSFGSIVYESPTQVPNVRIIYTPPVNSAVTLRFWEPTDSGGRALYMDHEIVTIYVGITRNISGRIISGSLQTSVNVRNLIK